MDEQGYKAIIEALIELVGEGVYVVDDDGIGLFYNQAMAKNEKINREDVIGKKFNLAFPGVSLNQSTMYQALQKGISTRNKQQTYTNLYGKEVTTVNSTVPVKVDGHTVAAIEIANDITNIRSLSDTILQLREDKMPRQKAPEVHIRRYSFDDICGQNEELRKVIDRAKRATQNDASVFIYGETGTGKELFAQSIHFGSNRKDKPFLAQNCAALPESLLEGILFGTSKGGFTGAVDRAGLFEQANGGTLLLDEISAMPYELQSKLLRVLQERYIRRVGGTRDIPIDVRIIATVNEPPQRLIDEGKLRPDLYYRLNVVGLTIPPLRARKDDIPILVDNFLAKYDAQYGKEVWMVSEQALKKLVNYKYPGNVRELENILAQSVAMADSEHVLTARHLQMPANLDGLEKDVENWSQKEPLNAYLANLEKEIIRGIMITTGGNVSKAAEILQIKRQTLQHKLKKYGISE